MAVYPLCRACLLSTTKNSSSSSKNKNDYDNNSSSNNISVSEVIKIVKDTSKDETVLKYLTRFRQKLKQSL